MFFQKCDGIKNFYSSRTRSNKKVSKRMEADPIYLDMSSDTRTNRQTECVLRFQKSDREWLETCENQSKIWYRSRKKKQWESEQFSVSWLEHLTQLVTSHHMTILKPYNQPSSRLCYYIWELKVENIKWAAASDFLLTPSVPNFYGFVWRRWSETLWNQWSTFGRKKIIYFWNLD